LIRYQIYIAGTEGKDLTSTGGIDRSVPMAAETEQMTDRRNSCLKSTVSHFGTLGHPSRYAGMRTSYEVTPMTGAGPGSHAARTVERFTRFKRSDRERLAA